MKHFLIKYRLQNASQDAWHNDVAEFIAALDGDPALRGKISYRCMKSRDGADYYHLAEAADEQAIKALQSSPFFSRYTEKTKQAAGGRVDVLPLEIVAETARKA
jgi:quinol monooxygenase YgiN